MSQCVPLRKFLIVANIIGFSIWVADVKFAYLQSDKSIMKRIFIRNPASEFELSPEELVGLLKPIYGLAYLGDEWRRAQDNHT